MKKAFNEDVESRRKFLESLGGAQAIARRHGAHSRQVVHNQIRDGFYHNWKPILIQDANDRQIEPHPELFKQKTKKIRWFSTKIGQLLHELSRKYDDFNDMAIKIGVPLSSLRSMCEANGYISNKHIPALEKAMNEKGITFPDWWFMCEDHAISQRNGRDRIDAKKRVYRRSKS